MKLGLKALRFSANVAMEGIEPVKAGKKSSEISSWAITLNLMFSLGFFIFLYKFVPLYLVTSLQKWVPELSGRIAFNAADGVIRMLIFIAFLFSVSRMKDIRRVFQYHGAEHKVVFNFESGQPVTVENAQRFTTFHPRCGTSFLLVVMIVSMIVYTFIPFDSFVMKFVSRIVLLPVISRPLAATHHHQAAVGRPGRRCHTGSRWRDGARAPAGRGTGDRVNSHAIRRQTRPTRRALRRYYPAACRPCCHQ
jgi:uncharacterized protein YqhQ